MNATWNFLYCSVTKNTSKNTLPSLDQKLKISHLNAHTVCRSWRESTTDKLSILWWVKTLSSRSKPCPVDTRPHTSDTSALSDNIKLLTSSGPATFSSTTNLSGSSLWVSGSDDKGAGYLAILVPYLGHNNQCSQNVAINDSNILHEYVRPWRKKEYIIIKPFSLHT